MKIKGFDKVYQQLEKKITISGHSASTLNNYSRQLARLSLHFNSLPEQISIDKINDFLYFVKMEHKTPSDSFFKHTIYGLRYLYRIHGMDDKRLKLPSIRCEKKLPVVLSKEEMRRLLKAPMLLKHRVLIALIYGCGLRCFESRNVKISDLDFDRRMLHVRQGKGKKDRYVPLSKHLIRGLKKYIQEENPKTWLFNGKYKRTNHNTGLPCSQKAVNGIVKKAKIKAGICKEMTVHTLRHTYATHLLEDGLDIVSIKNLLGHSFINTTMIYLHVAETDRIKPFSPLDTLYEPINSN